MKYLKFIIIPFIMLFFISCEKTRVLPESEVNKASKEKAFKLGNKIMNSMESGDYIILTEENASPEMVSKFTPDLQKQSYMAIKLAFGSFKSMKYHNTIKTWRYTIYRFKGTFGEDKNMEISVVFDKDDKLTGFFNRLWKDDGLGVKNKPVKYIEKKAEIINESMVNKLLKKRAVELAEKIMNGMKNGKQLLLHSGNASKEVYSKLTSKYLKNLYNKLSSDLGEYKSIEYFQALKKENHIIFRFKALFEDNKEHEIRFIFNEDEKLAEFVSTAWSDEYKEKL